jgi:phospholipid/cholesterol/gamma-HCH transport system permease protein
MTGISAPSSAASTQRPRLAKTVRTVAGGWNRLGEQVAFFVGAIRLIPEALVRYPAEVLRVIAQLSMGVGALAMIGGAVTVAAILIANIGVTASLVAHVNFELIGVFAVGGIFVAYALPRLGVPAYICFILTVTIGASSTAQLGAMRINEEIDALEVMGIRSVSYLVSTRVLAGGIVTVPLTCLAEVVAFVTSRYMFVEVFHQSAGGYEHYFQSFLKPADTLYELIQAVVAATVIMLICCFYGYTASGGPAGVGQATGRGVRAALSISLIFVFVTAMMLYGRSGDFHLSE